MAGSSARKKRGVQRSRPSSAAKKNQALLLQRATGSRKQWYDGMERVLQTYIARTQRRGLLKGGGRNVARENTRRPLFFRRRLEAAAAARAARGC